MNRNASKWIVGMVAAAVVTLGFGAATAQADRPYSGRSYSAPRTIVRDYPRHTTYAPSRTYSSYHRPTYTPTYYVPTYRSYTTYYVPSYRYEPVYVAEPVYVRPVYTSSPAFSFFFRF